LSFTNTEQIFTRLVFGAVPIYSGPATQTAELPAQPVSDDAADPTFGTGELIKTTTSICPECLEKIDATVYERKSAVYMDKECATHGRFTARLASERRHYYVADPNIESMVNVDIIMLPIPISNRWLVAVAPVNIVVTKPKITAATC